MARTPITLAVALAVALGPAVVASADAPAFVVIVHPKHPATKLDKKTIADAFLKKRSRWGDGKAIQPVDQAKKSGVRKQFSTDILGRSVTAVRTYWNQLVFSGRGVPPPEVESDADVVEYVTTHLGAIGYVSGTTDVKDAKVVQLK